MRRQRTIIIGDNIIKVTAYTAPNIPAHKLRCPHKGGISTAAQTKYNHKRSLEKLILKAENTYKNGCWFVTYTFKDIHLTEKIEDVFKYLKKVIADTKKCYEQKSFKCAYIASIEKGEKNGRIHCHVLYNHEPGINRNVFKTKWPYGKEVYCTWINAVGGDDEGNTIAGKVRYILKAPIKKTIGRAFAEPQEFVEDISEKNFNQLLSQPISVEKLMPGYKVIRIEPCSAGDKENTFGKIKILLSKESNIYCCNLKDIRGYNNILYQLHYYS